MKRSPLAVFLFLLSLVLAGRGASTAAEASPAASLVRADRHQLEWALGGEFESVTLTLSDPRGAVRSYRFGPGEAPALSLFDAQGEPLPDGTYTWELRGTPRRSAGRPAALPVQSGSFTVSQGNLVAPDLAEAPERIITAGDQTVPDDLIVDGKGCIGLGCVNNEPFSAEALRLKQSVVRLRFEDTSTAAGLPTRDWQLTVNDSASGGADRFSIEDLTAGTTPFTVRGAAPSNSLYVTGGGLVGLGTSVPSSQLHVQGSDPAVANTKILVTNTSTTQMSRELFEIRNNGLAAFIVEDTSVPERWAFSGSGSFVINNQAAAGIEYNFGSTGNLTISGTLTQNSDRTTKTDIQAVDPQRVLTRITELPISTWRKVDDSAAHLGPMAQDFRQAFGLGEDDRHIAPGDLAGVSLAAIQGLHALVTEQRQLIEKQQALIGDLAERLRRLETQEQQPTLEPAVQP